MDRLAIIGLAFLTAGAAGMLSFELIGTAHASRDAEKAYLVAVSSGSALRLMQHNPASSRRVAPLAVTQTDATSRRLACVRLVELADITLGFRCRAE